ncbi:type II secretion system F family protein, partial [Candidatus Peregrinibacteria bacterium]|nr:type II secretion system F family protein [Candidatus Peregrinibacteria bacterium]
FALNDEGEPNAKEEKPKEEKETPAKEKPKKGKKQKKKFSLRKNKKEGPEVVEEPEIKKEEVQTTLTLKEEKEKGGLGSFVKQLNYVGMGKQRSSFIQSLALMLGAGLSLIEALQALEAETRSRSMKKVVHEITLSVKSGIPLWRTLKNTCFFTPYEIALIHIGEDAGSLARNMTYLAEQQEKDHALKQKVKMAMIYPTIVMVMVFVIVIGLGMFVLPNLVQVLFSMNVELPLTTRILIKITRIFENYGTIIAPGCIAAFIGISLLSKFTRFKAVTQWFMFKLPGIGRLAKEATIARFGVILGGLLRAGVPMLVALESLVDVTQVVEYKTFYKKLLKHIEVGESFSKSFSSIKSTRRVLPVSVQQLVVTGEKSGTLSKTLIKISDIYQQKAEDTAEKLPIILEPILLLLIGAIVGTIAFAIITPIYSVVGNVGAG